MKKITEFYSTGTPTQIIIKVAVSLGIIYLVYLAIKAGWGSISEMFIDEQKEQLVKEQLENVDPLDGSHAPESWRAQAKQIANSQYNALKGTATDEDGVFEPLLPLTGAQLQMVYEEFGSKEGMNLHEWYREKLCAGGLNTCAAVSLVYYDSRVPECDSYFDLCGELEFAQEIWKKSGLTF